MRTKLRQRLLANTNSVTYAATARYTPTMPTWCRKNLLSLANSCFKYADQTTNLNFFLRALDQRHEQNCSKQVFLCNKALSCINNFYVLKNSWVTASYTFTKKGRILWLGRTN